MNRHIESVRLVSVSYRSSILLGLLASGIRHTYLLPSDTHTRRFHRASGEMERKWYIVGRGGDAKVEAHSRAHVWSTVYRSIERNAAKPVREFRTAETTAARHVAAATLTNSSGIRIVVVLSAG